MYFAHEGRILFHCAAGVILDCICSKKLVECGLLFCDKYAALMKFRFAIKAWVWYNRIMPYKQWRGIIRLHAMRAGNGSIIGNTFERNIRADCYSYFGCADRKRRERIAQARNIQGEKGVPNHRDYFGYECVSARCVRDNNRRDNACQR